MNGVLVLFILTVLLVALGLLEIWRHRRNLKSIPIRIHVNGTRGKSSVTRLIAAGLRAGGLVTCAKVTGTLPRMIFPNGREVPVFRPSRPNVIEQIRIVAAAAAANAQVLVLECMALQPELQWLCENKFVRATHGVITNVRADHLEVMGPGEDDVAKTLAAMIPPQGKLFTAEQRQLKILADAARDRSCVLTVVDEKDTAAVGQTDLREFSYTEHPDNVALALKVCEAIGVPRGVALAGMKQMAPDPGAMTEHRVEFFGRRVEFVNGFAANDPESTEHIWNLALDRHPDVAKRIAIFNCRADRPDRSLQLGAACARWSPADHIILMGSGTHLFARAAVKAGVDPAKLIFAEDCRVEEIFEMVLSVIPSSALVMGMGNIGGQGLDVVRYFSNRAHPKVAKAAA